MSATRRGWLIAGLVVAIFLLLGSMGAAAVFAAHERFLNDDGGAVQIYHHRGWGEESDGSGCGPSYHHGEAQAGAECVCPGGGSGANPEPGNRTYPTPGGRMTPTHGAGSSSSSPAK